jgi:hypothetical protein
MISFTPYKSWHGEHKDENEGRLRNCTNFWLTPPSLLRTGFGSTTNNTGFGSTANTGGSLFGGTSGGFGSSGGTSRLLQRPGISWILGVSVASKDVTLRTTLSHHHPYPLGDSGTRLF